MRLRRKLLWLAAPVWRIAVARRSGGGARPAAAGRGWDDRAGVAQARRIEGREHPQHRIEIVGREDERQVGRLVEAHAVLARDRAARAHARLHDLAARLFHAAELFAVAPV